MVFLFSYFASSGHVQECIDLVRADFVKMILLLGPWSGGESVFINKLMGDLIWPGSQNPNVRSG